MICSLFVTSRATLAGAMTFADQRWAPKKGKQRLSWPTSQWVKTSRSGTSCFQAQGGAKSTDFVVLETTHHHPIHRFCGQGTSAQRLVSCVEAAGYEAQIQNACHGPSEATQAAKAAGQEICANSLFSWLRMDGKASNTSSNWIQYISNIYQIISLHSDLEYQHSFCRGTPMLNKWEIHGNSIIQCRQHRRMSSCDTIVIHSHP